MAGSSIEAPNPTTSNLPDMAESTQVRRPQSVWLIAAVVVFLALGFALFRSTGQDDSYISYWPAHALAHYGRIVNYTGEAVEQSSSMLWVLMLGALAAVTHAPVPLLGPLLSIAGGVLSLVMVARLAGRIGSNVVPYAVLLAGTATYLLYWSYSGMEASFVGVCTAWLTTVYADYLAGKRSRKFEIAAATLSSILIRPEMGFVLVTLLVGLLGVLWARRRKELIEGAAFKVLAQRVGLLALLVIGLSVGVAAARIGYFHSPVPEPVLVKGGRHPSINQGLSYLFATLSYPVALPFTCLLLLGIGWALVDVMSPRKLNLVRLVCTMMLCSYGAFIVWVGGDWMLAGRFLVHILPVGLVLAADALSSLGPPQRVRAIGLTIVLAQAVGAAWFAGKFAVGTSLRSPVAAVAPDLRSSLTWFDQTNRLFLRDAPVAEALDRVIVRLNGAGRPVVHLFSGQMGIVMYRIALRHFGQIDVTDRHGLADRRLAGCFLAKGRPRLTNGLLVSYPWFLMHQKELESGCRIPSPDIIYDIEAAGEQSRALAIQQNGYALVYHRLCNVPQNRDWPHGDRIPVQEFIAVRRDLLPLTGLHEVAANPDRGVTRGAGR